MEIAGYIAALFIGVLLGLIGSGGSILTVPVLVYLMQVEPLLATTSSLFIVGCSSLAGALRAYAKNQIAFPVITEFGLPSVFSIFITRHFLLPAIPNQLSIAGFFSLSKGAFLMVLFAILMLASAYAMITTRLPELRKISAANKSNRKLLALPLLGLCIGVVTGLLGSGGGFLIIPFLVLILELPMKKAVGTSLLLIAINSLFGFVFSVKEFSFNWSLLLFFAALSVGGIFIGSKLSEYISGVTLKKAFGWFVLLMGLYIITKEILY